MFIEESTDTSQVEEVEFPAQENPFGDLENSGEQENDTSGDSSPETNETEEAPSQEGEPKPEEKSEGTEEGKPSDTPDENKDLPLNKDKRFKEVEGERNQLRDLVKAMSEKLEQTEKLLTSVVKPEKAEEEVPEWFIQAFGDPSGDKEANLIRWQAYKPVYDQTVQAALAQVEAKQAEAKKQEQEWGKWVMERVRDLQLAGSDITEEEFTSIVKEFEPADRLQGYDPAKVLKIHELKKQVIEAKLAAEKQKQTEKIDERKKLSSKLSSSKNDTTEDEYFTLDDSPFWQRLKKK